MGKQGLFTVALAVVVLFTLASSVRADSVHLPPGLEKLRVIESESLDLPGIIIGDSSFQFTEHFANNNGKHQGFSVAAFRGGLKFGLVNPRRPVSVSQNPEPTTILLLGTGLVTAAGLARRMRRTRKM